MSTWRRKAVEILPELRKKIEFAENPISLWIELRLEFDQYANKGCWDDCLRILKFASWCISDESGRLPNDTSTAVGVGFYEHLAENRDWWTRFNSWFTREQFQMLLPAFSYHLSVDDVEKLKKVYYSR